MLKIYLSLLMIFIAISCVAYFLFARFLRAGSFERHTGDVMARRLSKVYILVPPENLISITVMLSSFLFLSGFFLAGNKVVAGISLGFVMAVFGFFIPHIVISRLVEKHLQRLNEEIPPALEILSSSLRAGLTLRQAIERNIERLPNTVSQEFKIVLYECRLGKSLNEALNNFSERTGLMDAKLTAIASELSLRHGGNLSENYQNLARLIRDRYMFQKEVSALTAEGRMQAIVMTILPFAILLLMTLIRKKEMLEFLASPVGIASILTVFVMQVVAYIWINKVVSIDV
ncbi:MAG TPA: type II secretion system F family protein [Victivallales bacterium]|nr:type II secretion system F family protein [Victivallales bacterium]